ncbi:MAG: dATP pyrophosphohydrolase, partial [Hyphomicrobium sp.]
MSVSIVEIRPAEGGRALRDWLDVPERVFAGDASYVPPLRMAERQRVDARHNPFFRHGEAAFFVAYRGAQPIGRMSAQINHAHLARHQDHTGHFGFFDCIDDLAAARGLLDAAGAWLRKRDMIRMQGPFSLAINQEAGLLVAGFEQPPALMMGHARRWADSLLHACGLTKVVDLNAYRMSPA